MSGRERAAGVGAGTVASRQALDELVERVSAQVRWRRAEHHALRWLFWGALAAVALLAVRTQLGGLAIGMAGAALLLALVGGAARGFVQRVPALEAARVADRAFGLHDRLATALEWAARADRTPLVDGLVADAEACAGAVTPRQVIARRLPREARWLPLPLVGALVLVLAPPVPLPRGFLPHFSPGEAREEARERTEAGSLEQQRRPMPNEPTRRPAFEERDFVRRAGGSGAATAGDQAAVFKDTSLATQRPDFNSFLKKGDERLKMLAQADRLPDLQSDFTASQHRILFRRSKELRSGLRADQISPQKLRELLEELERLGRKGGNWGSDVADGMEALEQGQGDKAMEAMAKALDKLRAQEEQQRSGKGLRGGRDDRSGTAGRDRGRGGEGGDDPDANEVEGLLPGKGKSGAPKGEPSQRLRSTPYDASVEGESRKGRKDGYDTNMTGRAGQMASRLAYLGVIGQYRKTMEDDIAREQIPRDFHAQIRDYFQAIDER